MGSVAAPLFFWQQVSIFASYAGLNILCNGHDVLMGMAAQTDNKVQLIELYLTKGFMIMMDSNC